MDQNTPVEGSPNPKVSALTAVMMGTIKKFAMENPELGITLGDTQVALSRVYDELTRRSVNLRHGSDFSTVRLCAS